MQSATTSRVTSFLESVLNPVSKNFCKYKINQFCRDSKSYLEDLDSWKSTICVEKTKMERTLYIVAADVQALYPSVRRSLVESGLRTALQVCTDYDSSVIDLFVTLTMFCLQNVVVKNGTNFYNQLDGIITGDNHSVSVANITLHNIILPIADKLKESIIFKRYIDDVIWISETELLTNDIQATLDDVFVSNRLKLTFRRISMNQPTSSLEFLDINHVIDTTCRGGFYTTDFKKPTAINRRFLHGLSHHPRWIFKSIIFSESTRLRRLNEKHGNY